MDTTLVETTSFHLAKNFLVRPLAGEDKTGWEVCWGEGAERCYYKFPTEIAVIFMNCPPEGTRDEWIHRLADSVGVDLDDPEDVVNIVDTLISEGLLTTDGTGLTVGEEQWLDVEWHDALHLHWAEKDSRWEHDYTSNPKVMTRYGGQNVAPTTPPPTPYPCVPAAGKKTVVLPDSVPLGRPFRDVQSERRTAYQFRDTSIGLEDVATILSWTLKARWSDGVTPLRVTQSYSRGEPFVGFVAFGSAPPEGCEPHTIYQYDPASNVLAPLAADAPEKWSDWLWGQHYADAAPMTLVLAAHWDHFMWKYRLPRAYRWVYTECGSFMQTAITVATGLGLRAWQTPALDDERVGRALGVEEDILSPVYLAAFGRPSVPGA